MRKVLLLLALSLTAQTIAPGPQVLTFLSEIDDSDQPYAINVPNAYTPQKQWPLVISLHGADSNHRLNLRRVFGQGNRLGETDSQATRMFPALGDSGFIVASPLARGNMGYQGIAEKDVYDVLDDVKRRFSIDPDRVYLTGLSMGGGGTLWLGLTRPDIWAAIAAVCPAPPLGIEELAGNALNFPVKLFQGQIDPLVPAAQTRAWQQRFDDAGVHSEYVEYPGVRHNAWDYAYKNRAIFEWFRQFTRVSKPSKVHFASDNYAHASAYWLRFDKLIPGTLAVADAEFQGKRLTVRTKNLDGFTIDAGRAPFRPAAIEIDGTTVRLRPRTALSFTRTRKAWTSGAAKIPPGSKRPGAEGPIAAAISSRHIYLYGTEGSPGPDELIRRRDIAAHAADWSSPRSRLQLSFRVLSDKEATDSDLAGSNLVLFGTRATNSRIADIAGDLPLQLNPGAADYGLVYIYPVGERYVVISSGLPWWTRLDQANRPGLSFIAPAWRTLRSFGDFIVFRGGLDNVVAEGRFDNQWRLPAGVAETLRATGAVQVREP
jgi:predicted esterase